MNGNWKRAPVTKISTFVPVAVAKSCAWGLGDVNLLDTVLQIAPLLDAKASVRYFSAGQ